MKIKSSPVSRKLGRQRGHMETLVFIALVAIAAALLLPILARLRQTGPPVALSAWETFACLAFGVLFLVGSLFCIAVIRKVETQLNIGPLSIWTGLNQRQKVIKELVRFGVLVASGILAAIVWIFVNPEQLPWNSKREITIAAFLWAYSLMPVSVALHYGIFGARYLEDCFTRWYYRAGNRTLQALARR